MQLVCGFVLFSSWQSLFHDGCGCRGHWFASTSSAIRERNAKKNGQSAKARSISLCRGLSYSVCGPAWLWHGGESNCAPSNHWLVMLLHGENPLSLIGGFVCGLFVRECGLID